MYQSIGVAQVMRNWGQFPIFHSKFKHLDKGFFDEGNTAKPEGFIDLTALRFLDGLIKTLKKHTSAYSLIDPRHVKPALPA
jgi:hypothetical protein